MTSGMSVTEKYH